MHRLEDIKRREHRVRARVFHQGRQNEQMVDALALRAEEGRGYAAIRVGEPRAGIEPTISEWGNPSCYGKRPLATAEGTG